MSFEVTTVNAGTYTLDDLDGRTITHPVVDLDLSTEYFFHELKESSNIRDLLDSGDITVKIDGITYTTSLALDSTTETHAIQVHSDVVLTNPQNGDTLVYNNGVWVNGSPVSVYGSHFQIKQKFDFQSTTNEDNFVQYDRMSITTAVPPGKYEIDVFYVWSFNATNMDFEARVQVDDSIELINPNATDGNQGKHKQEVQDSGGGGNGGTNQRYPARILGYVDFITSGTHFIDLDFKTTDEDDAATIHQSIIKFKRVS